MKIVIPNVTAVAIDGRALLIAGEPGRGKSSLALALIDRGATLIGDDGIRIVEEDGHPHAYPPKTTEGLIEVRNVGLVKLPTTSAPVALALQLTEKKAPRYPTEIPKTDIGGVSIPVLLFRAGDMIQALRAEYALEKHGLTFGR